MADSEPVTFPAQIVKVQTMVDGGIRITFDTAGSETLAAAQLMELKQLNVAGEITFTPVAGKQPGTAKNAGTRATVQARRKRKSEWQAP